MNETQSGKAELGALQCNKSQPDEPKTEKPLFRSSQPVNRQYEELQPKMQKAEMQEREKYQHKEPGHDKLQPRNSQLGGQQPTKPSLKPHKASLPSLHRHLTPEEVKNLVDGALEVLKEERPDDYALLYELYFNGASLHALSRTLRIPRSTLRSRKKRALKRIKRIVENKFCKKIIKE
jgi:hypothetical protein